MTAIIEARGLGKQYRSRWALVDCTLSIPAGHVVGLVGPNGAGKTTLLHLATGSSRISRSGRLATARVRASWARWPPDSLPAFIPGSRPSLLIRSAASLVSQPGLRWAPSRRWSAMENAA